MVMSQVLLKSLVANLKSSSPAIRRTAASSAVSVCQHSRRASYFYTWLLNVLLGRIGKHMLFIHSPAQSTVFADQFGTRHAMTLIS